MSRAFFFNIPAHGHTNPTLPLVSELTRRGEDIVYYSSDTFRAKIESAGAEFRSYSSGVDFDCHNIDSNIFVNAGRLLDASRRLVPRILDELAGDRPDYVIHDSMCVWGKLGAGVRLPGAGLTAGALRESVREVLSNPSYREGANAIAESFESAGGYKRAADEIFAFKEAHGIT